MLEILYIIVMMVFLFSITIFVHEWGHFYVARKCGLVVKAFSIGMGPSLWQKEIDGVVYKIGAFPIGGYVSLPQLDPVGMEHVQGDNNEPDRATLPEVTPWKKIAVAVAGPLCNIIFALLLGLIVMMGSPDGLVEENGVFIAEVETESDAYEAGLRSADQILSVNGQAVKSWYEMRVESLLSGGEDQLISMQVINEMDGERTVSIAVNSPDTAEVLINGVLPAAPCPVKEIFPDTPAAQAGLQPNDLLIQINNQVVQGTWHFSSIVQENADVEIPLQLQRNGEIIETLITPKYNEENERAMIGIQFSNAFSLPWSLNGNPFEQIKSDASSIMRLLSALTDKNESKQAASGLGGPISIFTMIFTALKMSLITAIGLIRFININLAILNLLPLPVLDGGHICFALYEGITRRKIHPRVIITLINIFAVLLISAMLLLSWRDVDRNWGHFFKKAPAAESTIEPPTDP